MNENILDRLELFMKANSLNNNQITVQAGLSVGLIGKALKSKRGGLNSDSIEKILHAYPALNPTWFITGRGEMLTNSGTPNISKPTTPEPVTKELVQKMINEALIKNNLKPV